MLDLGSGAGFDAFIAARAVGASGHVIGVDMTDEMLTKARANATSGGYANVEFRKGTIEDLPVEDASVDVILSNCVINLSPEKDKVYAEAHRVLKPGGRLMVSDIVLSKPLPPTIAGAVEAYVGCIAGAELKERYLDIVRRSGFRSVEVASDTPFDQAIGLDNPQVRGVMDTYEIAEDVARDVLSSIRSISVFAQK